ncbi:MAG: histidine phosphatase family protein [Gammaproteobacteria bacterium]|nr:histidine phosphatase family protein [Gammaproteobacteria bacterium]MDH3468053.1 histidine phosphatase family protein [Gammaproteobacteria bacterium]
MSRHLLLLRHAKSDWSTGISNDFDRPLARRGQKATRRMAVWLLQYRISPDYVVCSSAARTRQTVELLFETWMNPPTVEYRDDLYLADVTTMLTVLAVCGGDHSKVMLVGHNPGCEELTRYLGRPDDLTGTPEKLIPTGTCVHFAFDNDWQTMSKHCANSTVITRPRELSRP